MKRSLGSKALIHPTPVWCVGSYDREGKPNVATIAWGGICCSKPPSVTVSLRKATYTYGNIMERKAYTVSVPSERFAREADYFGIVSGKTADKFAATGLTPEKSEIVNAPYVREFPLILECSVTNVVEVGLHTQFIGEVMDVKADEDILDENGLPDLKKLCPVIFTPESCYYYGIGELIGKAFSIGREIK